MFLGSPCINIILLAFFEMFSMCTSKKFSIRFCRGAKTNLPFIEFLSLDFTVDQVLSKVGFYRLVDSLKWPNNTYSIHHVIYRRKNKIHQLVLSSRSRLFKLDGSAPILVSFSALGFSLTADSAKTNPETDSTTISCVIVNCLKIAAMSILLEKHGNCLPWSLLYLLKFETTKSFLFISSAYK